VVAFIQKKKRGEYALLEWKRENIIHFPTLPGEKGATVGGLDSQKGAVNFFIWEKTALSQASRGQGGERVNRKKRKR